MRKPYTLLEHTADLRIRITGSDPADLFKNAGLALFDMIVDTSTVTSEGTIDLAISGEDYPDLMVNYLRELLYLWTGHEKMVTLIHIENISPTHVAARVTVGSYRPDRHAVSHEIKAVTYHQIEVAGGPAGWQAMVVLDI